MWSYKIGDKLTEPHFLFIRGLLDHHPHAADKIGIGIVGMVIHDNGYGPGRNQGFSAVRLDGQVVSFSYRSCISPKTSWNKIASTARREVAEQIVEFKKAAFLTSDHIICPILNIQITWDECDIDHQPPGTFDALLKRYLATKDLEETDIGLTRLSMGESRFTNRQLGMKWRVFHKATAKLRAVSRRANLSDIRKGAE